MDGWLVGSLLALSLIPSSFRGIKWMNKSGKCKNKIPKTVKIQAA